jgi:hypothetical protein
MPRPSFSFNFSEGVFAGNSRTHDHCCRVPRVCRTYGEACRCGQTVAALPCVEGRSDEFSEPLAVGAPVSICRSPGAHPSSHRDNDCEAMVKSLPNCGELGTGGWRNGFSSLWLVVNEMPFTLTVLLEESVQIAWDYLVRTGEIDDPSEAVRFLTEVIETMIRQGTKSRLLLSNRAITAYQKRNVGLKEQTAWRIQEWRPWSS